MLEQFHKKYSIQYAVATKLDGQALETDLGSLTLAPGGPFKEVYGGCREDVKGKIGSPLPSS